MEAVVIDDARMVVAERRDVRRTRTRFGGGMACSKHLEVVFVGSTKSGKTSLVRSYLETRFQEAHVPTVFDSHHIDIQLGEDKQPASLRDTGGSHHYDRLRTPSYRQKDIFFLCFPLSSHPALREARDVFYHEIVAAFPNNESRVVLVGTHADARGDNPDECVSTKEALDVALEIRAPYIEVSARSRYNIRKLFMLAVHKGIGPHCACSDVLFCPIAGREVLHAAALAFLTTHKYCNGPVCTLPREVVYSILEIAGVSEWKTGKYKEVSHGLWMPAESAAAPSRRPGSNDQPGRRKCVIC